MISVRLSKELTKKHEKRNFPVRKGDSVLIMRGEFKGKTAKIDSVDLKKLRVEIDGIYRTKKDGSKTNVYFDPSNLMIKEIDLTDNKRKVSLERKKTPKISGKKKNTDISKSDTVSGSKVEGKSKNKEAKK
jgi:large subunit ribosomal protein L24